MFCKHFANFVNHLNFFVCFFRRLQPVMPEAVLRSGFKSCLCQWHAPLAGAKGWRLGSYWKCAIKHWIGTVWSSPFLAKHSEEAGT